ncbi:L-fucose kinase [Geofilum rubicundum JCM 15548]|uniref:L-fucose kinase n=2 Tax=Geofilum TaxID=1236988 RepID=A0A0E9LZA9_9BACT|nr:L-fucose kinase [Geofilum rubicundum JCM 15548]
MHTLISVPENLCSSFTALFPEKRATHFALSDPAGARIGSGGGTAWLLAKHFRQMGTTDFSSYLRASQKIIIHAGGQSRRLPAYAPSGKVLSPIPVFRWSRGQNLQQNLLDLQEPFYKELLEVAPKNNHTLIASGDILILPGEHFNHLPEADIICLGIWADPHLASRHGVFFTPRTRQNELAFMLQKPNHRQIEELSATHLFLMDAGVWILSDKAIERLMVKCQWDDRKFKNEIPAPYDLYSEFGLALGTAPSVSDAELSDLSVAIVPLEKGEFYHYGTNLELITSTEKIQNRIKDQRAIWHNRVKPHPSLFVQNAVTEKPFTQQNHHIWVENSHIASGWQLQHHHILTGIPPNDWSLHLPAGICLDVVPLNDAQVAIRPYGMDDTFSGEAKAALWMGQALQLWLSARGLTLEEAGISPADDIQDAPLFPITEKSRLRPELIGWMTGENSNEEMKALWLSSERVSATGLNERADLVTLFRQRAIFAHSTLPKLAANYQKSIFYQSDLKILAQTYYQSGLDLPASPQPTEDPLLMARDRMFRAEHARVSGKASVPFENQAYHAIHEAFLKSVQHPTVPRLSVFTDQIVWARSPARLDLAGGWSDTPPYCLQSGGSVVNIAVDLNGQPPLQVFIRLSDKPEITLRSIDNGVSETITNYNELVDYTKVGSAFSIPRAALCLAGFHPNYGPTQYPSLEDQLKEFGGGIEISLLVAIPKGSGLGTSSILAATILGALSDFCALDWHHSALCHNTLLLEQMLTTGGGWQDQYGGILPGIKLLHSTPGMQNEVRAHWLPDRLFKAPEYQNNWLLYYTGITRVAKNILSEIVQGMYLNDGEKLRILDTIKDHAQQTAEAIQKCDYRQTAQMIGRSWQLNNQLDKGTNTPEIQSILNRIEPYTYGYKLLGAGGGGYLLICAKDTEAAQNIQQLLKAQAPNNKARFVDMRISETGLQISRS